MTAALLVKLAIIVGSWSVFYWVLFSGLPKRRQIVERASARLPWSVR